jgi:hypothetical protein
MEKKMKKQIMCLFIFSSGVWQTTQTADLQKRKKIAPKHSTVYIQKITNESDKAAFISLERIHTTPLNETIDLSAPLMSGASFNLHDPSGQAYSISIPVWQKTFRGNQLNVVTLSGNPGRIYFLYLINDHVWAIKAPEKKGDLKGFHLLNPSEKEGYCELKIMNNNGLKLVPINGAPPTSTQHKKLAKKATPQALSLKK